MASTRTPLKNCQIKLFSQNYSQFKGGLGFMKPCKRRLTIYFATKNEFVPTKYVRRNNDLPWINRELKRKFKKRKRLYDHARLTKNSRDWEAYKKIKNEIIIDLKQTHDAYCNYMFNATVIKFQG